MDGQDKDDFDIDIQACSTTDCTGLIPSLPQDAAEAESYEALYPYITKAVSSDPSPKPRPDSSSHEASHETSYGDSQPTSHGDSGAAFRN